MKKILLFLIIVSVEIINAQTTVSVNPTKDNSIFSENNNSNGQGSLFSGAIRDGDSRRSLIAFDFSTIPTNAIITGVNLELFITRSRSNNSQYNLHTLESDWGEGNSLATGAGGLGATAIAPDATWQDAMLGSSSWSTSGGDFDVNSSANTSISSNDASATFSSDRMIEDVQSWTDGTLSNFGWILIGDEDGEQNASRFDSKEGNNPPVLTITYTTTASTAERSLSRRVYLSPNPANNFFKIEIEQNSKPTYVEVFDLLGSKVFEANRPVSSTYSFNTNFNSGIYLVKISQGEQVASRKLIIR